MVVGLVGLEHLRASVVFGHSAHQKLCAAGRFSETYRIEEVYNDRAHALHSRLRGSIFCTKRIFAPNEIDGGERQRLRVGVVGKKKMVPTSDKQQMVKRGVCHKPWAAWFHPPRLTGHGIISAHPSLSMMDFFITPVVSCQWLFLP